MRGLGQRPNLSRQALATRAGLAIALGTAAFTSSDGESAATLAVLSIFTGLGLFTRVVAGFALVWVLATGSLGSVSLAQVEGIVAIAVLASSVILLGPGAPAVDPVRPLVLWARLVGPVARSDDALRPMAPSRVAWWLRGGVAAEGVSAAAHAIVTGTGLSPLALAACIGMVALANPSGLAIAAAVASMVGLAWLTGAPQVLGLAVACLGFDRTEHA